MMGYGKSLNKNTTKDLTRMLNDLLLPDVGGELR